MKKLEFWSDNQDVTHDGIAIDAADSQDEWDRTWQVRDTTDPSESNEDLRTRYADAENVENRRQFKAGWRDGVSNGAERPTFCDDEDDAPPEDQHADCTSDDMTVKLDKGKGKAREE